MQLTVLSATVLLVLAAAAVTATPIDARSDQVILHKRSPMEQSQEDLSRRKRLLNKLKSKADKAMDKAKKTKEHVKGTFSVFDPNDPSNTPLHNCVTGKFNNQWGPWITKAKTMLIWDTEHVQSKEHELAVEKGSMIRKTAAVQECWKEVYGDKKAKNCPYNEIDLNTTRPPTNIKDFMEFNYGNRGALCVLAVNEEYGLLREAMYADMPEYAELLEIYSTLVERMQDKGLVFNLHELRLGPLGPLLNAGDITVYNAPSFLFDLMRYAGLMNKYDLSLAENTEFLVLKYQELINPVAEGQAYALDGKRIGNPRDFLCTVRSQSFPVEVQGASMYAQ